MGENYLHEQVENSQKRRDRARQDLERPKLFTRPDITEVIYNVIPVGNEQLEDGETLLVIAARGREELDVLRNNVKVATIEGDGARKLHGELSKPENGGAISICISNVSKLSGGADGRLIEG